MVLLSCVRSVVLSLFVRQRKLFLWVKRMTEKTDKRQAAISLLQQKAGQLGRPPKRSDFQSTEVCFIKQKLGPWPRALEAAGLKEPPAVSTAEKSRRKRERLRQQRKRQARQNPEKTEAFSTQQKEEET